jgi:hypothetical protein
MSNKERTEADDIRVAFHESGHAAIGRQIHGTALGGVTVEPGEDYSGLCWGPLHDRRLKYSQDHTEPSMCEKLAGQIPGIGESRADIADLYLHCWNQIVELCAGTEAERMFCEGEVWFAHDDERKAYGYAALITSSPASTEALIAACRAEAVALLKGQAHVVEALAGELRSRRTLDGAEIDTVIETAVIAHGLEIERGRRDDWRRVQASAAAFLAAVPANPQASCRQRIGEHNKN